MPDAYPLWNLFMDLHASRSYTGMGAPTGISYQEIQAFASVRRRRLEPYHIDAIRALDREFLSTAAERIASQTTQQTQPSGRPDG